MGTVVKGLVEGWMEVLGESEGMARLGTDVLGGGRGGRVWKLRALVRWL